MKYITLLFILTLTSCTTIAYRKDNTMILKGYGAKQASWEQDGNKYSISRGEPLKIPELLPTEK